VDVDDPDPILAGQRREAAASTRAARQLLTRRS
jgi:hypothetical protein